MTPRELLHLQSRFSHAAATALLPRVREFKRIPRGMDNVREVCTPDGRTVPMHHGEREVVIPAGTRPSFREVGEQLAGIILASLPPRPRVVERDVRVHHVGDCLRVVWVGCWSE
ncbi:MAG: hypothetical protein AB7K09_02410 [Planctomycetota bacterium]